jgi:hypothetical protein
MGIYINPPAEAKEKFLMREKVSGFVPSAIPPKFPEDIGAGNVLVCLVDNGAFTAAGVIPDSREYEEFAHEDGRFKLWFVVPLEKLKGSIPGCDFDYLYELATAPKKEGK